MLAQRAQDTTLTLAPFAAVEKPWTFRAGGRHEYPKGHRVLTQRDRAAAIALAVGSASAKDIVLVAGKGHETYQEIRGTRLPFSDAAAVRAALEARQA